MWPDSFLWRSAGQSVSTVGPKKRVQPARLQVSLLDPQAALVDRAIGWLDVNWRGGVFVPDELLPLVAVGRTRECTVSTARASLPMIDA
jgi:hypothetical protein